MPTKYQDLVSSIVEGLLETTGTGAIGVVPSGLTAPIDGKKVADAAVDPKGATPMPVTTLAQMYPDVFLPLLKTQKHHSPPKGDQTGGYDTKRPDTIIANQNEQVKSGIISIILRAGQDQARAEAEAKAQEKATEIAANKEQAAFELKHGGKVLDQKTKEWQLEKEKLLFKAKHKPKLREGVEDQAPKYSAKVGSSRIGLPSNGYDHNNRVLDSEHREGGSRPLPVVGLPQLASMANFEDVVSTVLGRMDSNLDNPIAPPSEKDMANAPRF